MNNKQLDALLDKYVKGLCTQEEAAVINEWYDKYKHDQDVLDSLSDEQRVLLKSRMLTQVLQQVDCVNAEIKTNTYFNNLWFKLAIAAVLLVFVKIIYSGYFKTTPVTKPVIEQIKVVNNSYHMLKQILPDKSIVWLDPKATIAFPKVSNKNSRNLIMEGECFFEITKNPKCPFIIHSNHLITKVWGTSFKISDKMNMPDAQVTVITGKVSVSVKGSKESAENNLVAGEVILLPKQQVTFKNESNTLFTTKLADMSGLNRYTHISLLFNDEKLSDIVAVLNKKFDVDIRIEDKSLNSQVMDADLSGLNLPEVLEVLKASLQINYEMKNDLILLKKPVI